MIISDSMAKYVAIQDVDIRAFRGYTLKNVTDRIRFDKLDVSGYTRILIHVGSNDISNMVDKGQCDSLTIFDMKDRYEVLRNSIRRRNSAAVLLFSAILPRVNRYQLFKGYIRGINFAVEKLCAKSRGACIFIPSFNVFMLRGKPREALFSDSDGLHLTGGGVDVLESCFQQALSTGYLLDRVRAGRTHILKVL